MPLARLGASDAAAARRVLSASVLRIGAPGGGVGGGSGASGLPAVAPLHMGLDFWAGQGEGCAVSLGADALSRGPLLCSSQSAAQSRSEWLPPDATKRSCVWLPAAGSSLASCVACNPHSDLELGRGAHRRMSKRLVFPACAFLLSGGALAAYGVVGGAVAEVAALPAANAERQPLEPRSVAFSAARGAWLLFFRALGAAGGAHGGPQPYLHVVCLAAGQWREAGSAAALCGGQQRRAAREGCSFKPCLLMAVLVCIIGPDAARSVHGPRMSVAG